MLNVTILNRSFRFQLLIIGNTFKIIYNKHQVTIPVFLQLFV